MVRTLSVRGADCIIHKSTPGIAYVRVGTQPSTVIRGVPPPSAVGGLVRRCHQRQMSSLGHIIKRCERSCPVIRNADGIQRQRRCRDRQSA
jgi:hypothetical protein